MKKAHKTLIGAILTAGLCVSFSLPAAASSTTPHYFQNYGSGLYIQSNPTTGALSLGNQPRAFEIKASLDQGVTWYEYVDGVTGLCLQANVADTAVAEGGCEQNARQFWYWSSTSGIITNNYFGSHIEAKGTSVDLGSGSTTPFTWNIS